MTFFIWKCFTCDLITKGHRCNRHGIIKTRLFVDKLYYVELKLFSIGIEKKKQNTNSNETLKVRDC